VRAELELLNLTTQTQRRLVRIERDQLVRLGGFEDSGGRFRVGITDKENRMFRIFDDTARESIRERLRRHHSARESVDPSSAGRRILNCLAVENERIHLLEQLQTRQEPAHRQRTPIVDLGHLHAQTADVDRKLAQQFLLPEFVNHAERLLRFAQRKDRHKDAAPGIKGALDRVREAAFLALARETLRQRVISARRLHDENIHA
jgi:hypothetical protein